MSVLLNARIGFFLAVRQIRRSSLWTTTLIIFVMVLTFLNLVVVSGILVGLIQGSVNAQQEQYTSDIIISTLNEKKYIENTSGLTALIRSLPQVEMYSARYLAAGTLEANYQTRTDPTDKTNTAIAQVAGIDPVVEDSITNLSDFIVEGEYLKPTDYDQILLGSSLLKEYVPVESPGLTTLEGVRPGSKIRVNVNGVMREVTVKGIIESKVNETGQRAYMVQTQLRNLLGRSGYEVNEIVLQLKPGTDPQAIKQVLVKSGMDSIARIQTFEDAQPKFLKDIIKTFALLGNVFSSIGLVVASITIFIVIFINALTRRKFIGILKGIGIHGGAIKFSYVFQSIFYALCGVTVGLLIVYVLLVPYIARHPIDFPFSDGILVAPVVETALRSVLLVVASLIAGYIPARMIVNKNTLDSILGRK